MAMNASLNNQVDSVTISGGSPIATAYDPRGNMTGAVGEVIFFDALDRVYRSKNDLVGDYTFLHNGAGERVLKFSSKFTVLRREMARYIAEANIIARGWTLPLCDGFNPSPSPTSPARTPTPATSSSRSSRRSPPAAPARPSAPTPPSPAPRWPYSW